LASTLAYWEGWLCSLIWQTSNSKNTETAANQFQPYSAYWSGYCYWKSGKKDKIQPLFQQVHKWVKPNAPADVYAERKCKEVLAEGGTFNAFEEMFVPILATHEAKTYDQKFIQ
jgi:hypothetical protein